VKVEDWKKINQKEYSRALTHLDVDKLSLKLNDYFKWKSNEEDSQEENLQRFEIKNRNLMKFKEVQEFLVEKIRKSW